MPCAFSSASSFSCAIGSARPRRRRRCGGGVLRLLLLLLLRTAGLLAATSGWPAGARPVRHGGGGTGDHRGAGNTSEESGHGRCPLFVGQCVGGVERRDERVLRDVSGGDELGAAARAAPATNGVAQRFSKIKMPADEPGSITEPASSRSLSSSRPDDAPSKIARSSCRRGRCRRARGAHGAVGVAGDEQQVEDADHAAVDEVDEDRRIPRPSSCCRGTRRSGS